MMRFLICALLGATCAAFSQGMRDNAARSLFSDQKAAAVGDAVTILVVEASSASNDAKTSTSKASDLSLASSGKVGSGSLPEVGLGVNTGNSFKGEGSTATHGSVQAKLSARVDSVLPNGSLCIKGTRTIVIGDEEQTILIAGIVRPSDIAADNSVYSYNLADASIVFKGNGVVTRAQGPGWITKLLHWLF
jgi:flagellar L-ring protein precursor FlgH